MPDRPQKPSSRPSPDEPGLLPYLPMIYVAWADGDLDAAEIRAICDRLASVQGDDRCAELLGRWLEPEAPPTAVELQALLALIRTRAGGLTTAEKSGLTGLGLALARAGNRTVSTAEEEALAEIERALGLGGVEATGHLLVRARPQAPGDEAPPDFPLGALRTLLDADRPEIRHRVRALLCRPEFRYRYGLDREAYRGQVLEWARLVASEGIGALSFPRSVGGGGDLVGFIAAFETLAFGDLSLLVKCGVQFGLFGGSILQLGSEEHHRRFLPAVATLELLGGFAMSETGHGSNVYDLQTVARYLPESDEFEIHTPHETARKDWIGNAARDGRMMTVFAQLEIAGEGYGVHAFLVPIRDETGEPLEGVRIEDCGLKMGLNGVDNGRLWFDHVRIPRSNLLDRFGGVNEEGQYASPIASPSKRFFTMLGTLVGGRISVAKAALSGSKSALAIAVRYAIRRRQFGPAGEAETVLLDYLTHQRRLLPRLATTYALDFTLKDLATRFDSAGETERREIEALAAGLKAFSTWHATDTIQTCREACGGQGYLEINRLPALKADTDVFTTFEGDNIVLQQLLAKGLLTDYKKQFGGMNLLGLLRFVTARAATSVAELNPVVVRRTDEAHLRDRRFQLAAFRWRADHQLNSLARRLKKRLDAGMDPFHALVEVQDHAVATARAHTEKVILQSFAAAVEHASRENGELAPVLSGLVDLFALSRLELDRGWFQEHGYLESAKARAIRRQVVKLCGEIRPRALPLVDAFGIPDEVLAAPIAS